MGSNGFQGFETLTLLVVAKQRQYATLGLACILGVLPLKDVLVSFLKVVVAQSGSRKQDGIFSRSRVMKPFPFQVQGT